MSRRILVTGGAGYIGSILTQKLLGHGYEVTILDNFTFSDIGIRHLRSHPRLTILSGDIRDQTAVQEAVKNVYCVIHLAAIANDPSGELDPQLTRSINLDAYEPLLEASRRAGVRRFINASTFSVYGINDKLNITEEEPLNPLKEYSICKAKSEMIVKKFNTKNFITVNLRCATVCGWSPRMRFDLIVNTLTGYALVNKKVEVWGGDQTRPQIHIEDLTDYFIKLINVSEFLIGGETFNAGAENPSISSVARIIRQVIGEEIDIEMRPPRHDERSYHVSSEKIKRILGLTPERTIAQAISDIKRAYEQGLWSNPEEIIYHNLKRVKKLIELKNIEDLNLQEVNP